MIKHLTAIILALLIGGSMALAKDGDGKAVIGFDGVSGKEIEVPCGAVGTWTVKYTVPDGGIPVGGSVKVFRIPNKYWLGQCKQIEDPKMPDYLTAKRSDGGKLEFTYIGRFYKDHVEAVVTVRDTPIKAGGTITLTFGDRSGGSIGAVVPFSWQPPCVYHVETDLDGDGQFAKLAEPLVIRPIAGKVTRFVVNVPLLSKMGEEVTLNIRAEDRGSNVSDRYTGDVVLSCTDSNAKLPEKITFVPKDKGVKSVKVAFNTPGIYYVEAKSADGKAAGSSNPVKVTKDEPGYRIYWGDLHCHTEESDGTGSLDFNYQYARDVSWMDFIGVTDHLVWDKNGEAEVSCDGPIKRALPEWNNLQSAAARKYNRSGKFVTFLGYEWSGGSEAGGDHNVYYMDDQATVTSDHDLNEEFRSLRSRGYRQAFILPHVGGRIADPKWHDPEIEPGVEVNSMHGHFEWLGQEYLEKGYKIGFNGGSDGHFGLPGNDIWPNHGRLGLNRRDVSVPQGTTCVYAPRLTRAAVRDAFFDRRTYATTDAKILLEVTMDGHMMGSDYSSKSKPKIHILAAGTGKIGRVEVIRNKERIINVKTDGRVVDLDFTDDEPASGVSYYYVRISQEDGEIAWSSPIFFTYTGSPIQQTKKHVPWNYESEEDELGDPVDKDYLPGLLDHLKWRAPDRFYGLKQVRMVHSPRGDYALFYGYDKSNDGGKIHIRWYTGFDSFRIHVTRGWRDFGSERE